MKSIDLNALPLAELIRIEKKLPKAIIKTKWAQKLLSEGGSLEDVLI